MKKMLVLVVAAMMATVSVNAQNDYEQTKHEIAVSYGYLSNSQWLEAVTMSMNILEGLEPASGKAIGPINAEYFYNATKWLGVGAIFSFGQVTTHYNLAGYDEEVYTNKNTSYTVMPAVKFNWFRRAHFGMYSKLGAGLLIYDMKAIPVNTADKTVKQLGLGFNWQATVLGLEFGGVHFRGFVEGGLGEQGVVCGGLRYRF